MRRPAQWPSGGRLAGGRAERHLGVPAYQDDAFESDIVGAYHRRVIGTLAWLGDILLRRKEKEYQQRRTTENRDSIGEGSGKRADEASEDRTGPK